MISLLIVAIGFFAGLGIRSVQAASTVTVEVVSFFDDENIVTTNLTNQTIGSKVSFQSHLSSLDGYVFAYWIYNGIIQEGAPESTSFTITSDTQIKAIFRPTDLFACLFMDANGHLIDVQYVASGMSATDIPSLSLPTKPGYVVTSGKWDRPLNNITQNTVFLLQYELATSATYSLSVTNGTGDGSYAFDDVATIVANTLSGQYFQYWKIGDRIVSRQSTYAFSIHSNTTIEAVYSDSVPTDVPMVSVGGNLNLRSGYQTFVGQFHLPSGYEYVEHGLVVSASEVIIDLSSASITRYQGAKYNPLTNEFVMSLPDSSLVSYRAYLIAANSSGDLMTVYDEVITEAVPSATDLLFTEYIEGSSNNKALEIYNGTSSTVNLADYSIAQYNNGSSTVSYSLGLSGTLSPGQTYVVYNSSSSATLVTQAQSSDVLLSSNSAVMGFNGNDALALRKAGVTIDLIGVIGSSTDYAINKTMVRKAEVVSGVTTYDATQWTSYATDTFSYLGDHSLSGGSSKTVSSIEAHWPNRVYQQDDVINLSNGYVRVFYSDGSASTEPLTSGMVSGFSTATAGSFTATITHQGKTDTMTYSVSAYSSSTDLEIHYIDIGATGGGPGEAALIQYDGIDILVDSGENNSLATNALLAFLSAHVTDGTIEYIIATHQDADHIGGFTEVLDAYAVTNAILYSTPSSEATVLRNTFETRVATEGSTVYYSYDLATASDPTITIAEGIELQFVDTNFLQAANANYSSIVFVLDAFRTRVLFNGDAEQNQENVYAPLVGDVDIFKLGHHGTVNATTATLLNNITPEVAIVTNGDFLGNEYNHPTYAALARIYSYSNLVPVYAVTGGNWTSESRMSQRNGTITVTVNGSGYAIASANYGANPIELSATDYWANALNTTGSEGYYYAEATGISSASGWKDALSLVIDGHTSYSYAAIIDIMKVLDADPNVAGNVLLFYTNRSQSADTFVGSTGNQDYWNREHIWAQSHGIDEALPGYTDLHHLRVTDVSVNGDRGDLDFGIVATHDASTLVEDTYGTVSTYNYIGGSYFEPRDEIKGDVARMMFYMAVRYEGNNGEVDLELVNGTTTSSSNNLGDLATLLFWNELDPVSDAERNRNDLVYSYQDNRNPFIDHPEWVEQLFGNGE